MKSGVFSWFWVNCEREVSDETGRQIQIKQSWIVCLRRFYFLLQYFSNLVVILFLLQAFVCLFGVLCYFYRSWELVVTVLFLKTVQQNSKIHFLVHLQEHSVLRYLSNHAGCQAGVPKGTAMPDYPPHHYSGSPSLEEHQYKNLQAVAA